MKKPKSLIVRITESQFKKLAFTSINESKSKSTITRNALDDYFSENDKRIEKQNQNNNKDLKTLK